MVELPSAFNVDVVSLITVLGTVSGDQCDFPPDHPTYQSDNGLQFVHQIRVYVYTDTFGDCSGCVRAVNFCYSPRGDAATETLFTVEIRKNNDEVETSRDVIVYPDSDRNNRTNCLNDGLDCCLEQILAEPFSVVHNRHYALRIPLGLKSLLLQNISELANGHQIDINNGATINSPLHKPLFFFSINSSMYLNMLYIRMYGLMVSVFNTQITVLIMGLVLLICQRQLQVYLLHWKLSQFNKSCLCTQFHPIAAFVVLK